MKRRPLHLVVWCMVWLAANAAWADEPATDNEPAEITFGESATAVDVYDFVEVTINVTRPTAVNPFTDVVVAGEFSCEDGEPRKVDGFCDAQDGSVFRIRLMPTKPGLHRYSVTSIQRTNSGSC